MKRNYIILLMILTGSFDLAAQKTVCGIKSAEFNTHYTGSPRLACDTIFSFTAFDDIPAGLAFDGSYFYSTGDATNLIFKYDINGEFVESIPCPGSSAGDLDFDGTYLWMVSEQDRTVYKMDKANGNVISSFLLPTGTLGDPNNYGCAYDNGYLWTTEYYDGTLMRLNAATGALVDSFPINRMVLPIKIIHGNLYGIEFVDKTAMGPTQLIKFDKFTGSVTDSIPWCLPYPLGLSWAVNHLWGLSSGFGIGTRHIYEFDSLLSSTNNIVPINDHISVFPNPSADNITINTPQKSEIEILNTEGQTIKHITTCENHTTIGISEVPVGIYMIKVKTPKGMVVKKLIKE